MERDEKVLELLRAGCSGVDIRQALHIGKDALQTAKRRLRKRGEIT